MSIYDAAMKYKAEGVPLVIFAGVEYGNGSSRDWAAKGTNLLGVKAVVAQSFERIHRSNLVGMGIVPFVFEEGTTWASARPQGRRESSTIDGLEGEIKPREKKIAKITYSRRHGEGGAAAVPHRYAGRGDLHEQWRHSADRSARPGGLIEASPSMDETPGAKSPGVFPVSLSLFSVLCRSPLRDFLLKGQ
jgi:hypothetical protein